MVRLCSIQGQALNTTVVAEENRADPSCNGLQTDSIDSEFRVAEMFQRDRSGCGSATYFDVKCVIVGNEFLSQLSFVEGGRTKKNRKSEKKKTTVLLHLWCHFYPYMKLVSPLFQSCSPNLLHRKYIHVFVQICTDSDACHNFFSIVQNPFRGSPLEKPKFGSSWIDFKMETNLW